MTDKQKVSNESPLFWYRPRSDGGYEGPLHNGQIEGVRKASGAWVPLFAGAAPVNAEPVAHTLGKIRVGRLPTMNQDEYPGLGGWWVQLRIGSDGEEVLARVYGDTPEQAHSRATAIAQKDSDPLQGAADWLVKDCGVSDSVELASRLSIGYNRASRLLDAARKEQA